MRHIDYMRDVIREAFYRLSRKTSFAVGWVEKVLCFFYNSFANDYIYPAKSVGFVGTPGSLPNRKFGWGRIY